MNFKKIIDKVRRKISFNFYVRHNYFKSNEFYLNEHLEWLNNSTLDEIIYGTKETNSNFDTFSTLLAQSLMIGQNNANEMALFLKMRWIRELVDKKYITANPYKITDLGREFMANDGYRKVFKHRIIEEIEFRRNILTTASLLAGIIGVGGSIGLYISTTIQGSKIDTLEKQVTQQQTETNLLQQQLFQTLLKIDFLKSPPKPQADTTKKKIAPH
jgi:uncharacterized coiled-coil protein SlyX